MLKQKIKTRPFLSFVPFFLLPLFLLVSINPIKAFGQQPTTEEAHTNGDPPEASEPPSTAAVRPEEVITTPSEHHERWFNLSLDLSSILLQNQVKPLFQVGILDQVSLGVGPALMWTSHPLLPALASLRNYFWGAQARATFYLTSEKGRFHSGFVISPGTEFYFLPVTLSSLSQNNPEGVENFLYFGLLLLGGYQWYFESGLNLSLQVGAEYRSYTNYWFNYYLSAPSSFAGLAEVSVGIAF